MCTPASGGTRNSRTTLGGTRASYGLASAKAAKKMRSIVAVRAAADREEQPAFVPERAHPAQLRQPAFNAPVVGRAREQRLRPVAQYRARVCPQVLDVILGKPAL